MTCDLIWSHQTRHKIREKLSDHVPALFGWTRDSHQLSQKIACSCSTIKHGIFFLLDYLWNSFLYYFIQQYSTVTKLYWKFVICYFHLFVVTQHIFNVLLAYEWSSQTCFEASTIQGVNNLAVLSATFRFYLFAVIFHALRKK